MSQSDVLGFVTLVSQSDHCVGLRNTLVSRSDSLGFVTLVSQSDALGFVTHLRLSLMRWAL